jgi:hypothetical protein
MQTVKPPRKPPIDRGSAPAPQTSSAGSRQAKHKLSGANIESSGEYDGLSEVSADNAEPAANNSMSQELDHSYSLAQSDTPRKLKRRIAAVEERESRLRKKLKITNQQCRRLKKKVISLLDIISKLEDEKMVTPNAADVLKSSFSDVPQELLSRMLTNAKRGTITRATYPPVLRAFALTLSFYSAKGYDFVRKTFNLSLPHPSTLRCWYSSVNGEPGFTDEVFAALKIRVQQAHESGHELVCSLMLDEMSIRKHMQWDGYKFRGFVDIGTVDKTDDSAPPATEVLVFMIVSLNSHWKVPCAYFLIAGLSGVERANLLTQCLLKLHDVGVNVACITCDGPSTHFAMYEAMGAHLKLQNLQTRIPHPADSALSVYVMFDACHMLKLMRNALAELGTFVAPNGKLIKWVYIDQLHQIQQREGLRLGNRLTTAHLAWQKQKMKVNLAAQTFSDSVADAVEFCRKDLNLPEFSDSEETVTFMRLINRLFDILNSRNPLGKGSKAALAQKNEADWHPFLAEAVVYISRLASIEGKPLHIGQRKTPFIGFIIAIASTEGLFEYLVKQKKWLKYLLTYKCSQDHLELFFCAIRSCGGWNNNPTAMQVAFAYRRLLVRHHIEASNGNATVQDNTAILHVTRDSIKVGGTNVTISEVTAHRRLSEAEVFSSHLEHDYSKIPDFIQLSRYLENVVTYIAGYVVKSVEKETHCDVCKSALLAVNDIISPTKFALLNTKNRGGLKKASQDVIVVCEATEKFVRHTMSMNDGALPKGNNIVLSAYHYVVQNVSDKKAFACLHDHMFDCDIDDNHVHLLVKQITKCYLNIRMYHLGKQHTSLISGTKIRKELSKLILFKHQ